jgi:hypothetical protein
MYFFAAGIHAVAESAQDQQHGRRADRVSRQGQGEAPESHQGERYSQCPQPH